MKLNVLLTLSRYVKTLPPSLSTGWQKLLKICLLEIVQVCQATKLHTWEERCNARAHKLENLPPETCSCLKANQKAWRNLTAGRLASLLPPLLLLSSVVEGISMAGAYSPGSISIQLYLSWFPVLPLQIAMKKVLKHMLSRLLRCISMSECVHVCACSCVCYSIYFSIFVCVCLCAYPLGDAV